MSLPPASVPSTERFVAELIEVLSQRAGRVEFLIAARLEILDAYASRLSQSLKSGVSFLLPALHEPKPFTQDFAGVLIAAGADELFYQFSLMFREDDVSGRHGKPPSALA